MKKMKNDPDLKLILEEEIHEIQRIWRMEQGDWQNSVYQIYKKVTGIELQREDDQGMFGQLEQELLKEVAETNDVPQVLLSKLIDAEWDAQGMTRHSKVYDKLNSILNEEWREKEELEEIKDDMRKRKKEKQEFKL